jgi:peptide/nickel transport system substrate-binding protein
VSPEDRPGRWRRALPPVGLLLLAAACVPLPDRATTLTVVIDSGPASLDPRLGSDEASKRVSELIYNGLFRVDEMGRPAADLAEAWDRPDPRTVRVRLRSGVRFQDGAPLTARDVVYTYRSILQDEVPSFRKGDLITLRDVEAIDDRTVLFRLSEPFTPMLTNLNVPILREGAGPEAALHPVGTGPFRLLRYRKDEDLLLSRFDDCFAGRAGVASLHLKIVPTETGRRLELLKGSADMVINDLSPDQIERLRGVPGMQIESRAGRNLVYMAFNLADPTLRHREVRQAIALALDRDTIVAHLLHGAATPATGLLPPGHWAYAGDVPRYDHDPVHAAALLDMAGYPDPDGPGPGVRFTLTYKTTTAELAQQQAAIIQEQLGRVGIGVQVRAYEWATFYDDLKAGRFQLVVSNWTEITDPDIYRLRFHSAFRPPRGFNRGGYANPEIDRLLEAGASAPDERERRSLYARVQAILAGDLPYVVLWHRDVVVASRRRVHGFHLTPGADFAPLRSVTLDGAPDATPAPR